MLPKSRKCRLGITGEVNPMPTPCDKTMKPFQLAVFLVASSKARELAARSVSMTLSVDGKSFGIYHALGGVLAFHLAEPGEVDAFNQTQIVYRTASMCLPLIEAANKIATDVEDKDGKVYALVTPLAVGTMVTLSNLQSSFATQGGKITSTSDAAADNRGGGNRQQGMDSMCNKGGIMYGATVERTIWTQSTSLKEKAGLYIPLHRFSRRDALQSPTNDIVLPTTESRK